MTAEAPTPKKPHTTAEKLAELREKLELAKEPGGEKAVAKRAKKGIPSARDRIVSSYARARTPAATVSGSEQTSL